MALEIDLRDIMYSQYLTLPTRALIIQIHQPTTLCDPLVGYESRLRVSPPLRKANKGQLDQILNLFMGRLDYMLNAERRHQGSKRVLQ